MEIVKKEIIKRVSEYKYYGFLCYLLKNSQEVRDLFLDSFITFYDIDYSQLSNEYVYEDRDMITYDLKVFEKNGNSQEFDSSLSTDVDDLVIYFKLCTKDLKTIDHLDLKLQFNFYILCDSEEDIFNEFIIRDTDIRKVIGVNRENLSVEDRTYMDFHFTVSLDHIVDIEVDSDFKEIMYLLKYNKAYDEKSVIYLLVNDIHKDYLNSESYVNDLNRELERARIKALK